MASSVPIRWKSHTFPVEVDDFEKTTIADLKAKCHNITGVAVQDIKLIAWGAIMKDDKQTLSHYRVDEARYVRMRTIHHDPSSGNSKVKPSLENEALEKLQTIQSTLENDIPSKLNEFEKITSAFITAHRPDANRKKVEECGLALSEQLMQLMLSLDEISCPLGSEAHKIRKSNVNRCHSLLERVDNLKQRLEP